MARAGHVTTGTTGVVPSLPGGGGVPRRPVPDLLGGACGPQPAADYRASPTSCSPPLAVSRARPGGRRLQGLPVAEEFVVLVVSAKAAADVGEVGDELDRLDPFDLFEAEFELVAQP